MTFGGWDHHEDTLGQQATMLPALDAGLGQFQSALEELGLSNQVTTFTISDFGRTLTSNGRGSDHGWGGNAMIMGGSVQGAAIWTLPRASRRQSTRCGSGPFPTLDSNRRNVRGGFEVDGCGSRVARVGLTELGEF